MKVALGPLALVLIALGGGNPERDAPNEPMAPREEAVALACAYLRQQEWSGDYAVTTPVGVEETTTGWMVYFGRAPDRQADPAQGVIKVHKRTRETTWIPQK